jgi:hypothetical protein
LTEIVWWVLKVMTESPRAPDIVDDGTTDVLAEDEIVHVPAAGAELAEATGHSGEPGFIADVPDWDKEDPLP